MRERVRKRIVCVCVFERKESRENIVMHLFAVFLLTVVTTHFVTTVTCVLLNHCYLSSSKLSLLVLLITTVTCALLKHIDHFSS